MANAKHNKKRFKGIITGEPAGNQPEWRTLRGTPDDND